MNIYDKATMKQLTDELRKINNMLDCELDFGNKALLESWKRCIENTIMRRDLNKCRFLQRMNKKRGVQ